jgi:AAA+ ATPase superfamily predicted ATPase
VEVAVEFWGRTRERLHDELGHVRTSGTGRMLAIRGRRQVGKSRLLTEMVEQAGVPYLFTTAVKNGTASTISSATFPPPPR